MSRRFEKVSDRPVDLSYEDFVEIIESGVCHYCETPVEIERHTRANSCGAYGLDRKDNTIGYTKDNCVLCCARCNSGKSDIFTYDQWKYIGQCIRDRKDLFQ
jgi:hypothetical protein